MKNKRGKKLQINFSNRWLYTLVTLGIIIILAAGIYALTAGTTPNPGHSITEMGVPSNCVSASALMWDGSSLVCGNNYLWNYRYFPAVLGPQESTKSIKTKIIELLPWNMDAVSQMYVDYGSDITWDKVVRVSVLIRSDSDALNKKSTNIEMGGTWEISPPGDNNLMIIRTTGGIFDNTDFDYAYSQVSRGWVVINYYT